MEKMFYFLKMNAMRALLDAIAFREPCTNKGTSACPPSTQLIFRIR
jgi:hypothetical protein